ncbi:c-type cytochrome biogenesis protein CcmI [Mesorhizobium sp. CAU 1741]|uniref:c-type cytochrome biogenesis protein CcmI n=1 Tax=Mesorhizobium sp. CAU 1741 TaxID=3140366 RepID=UPI00325A4CD8
MLFWIIAAVMTLGACLAILLPAMRERVGLADDSRYDLEVYQDQLAELDRDLSRGVIDKSDAEQARAEIGRRILRLDDQRRASGPDAGSNVGRSIATIAVLAVPLVSWGLYAATGSPELPGQPLAARINTAPEDSSMDVLVVRAEAHLSSNPEDGRGWDVLAPIYYRMGRFNDSSIAYRNAIRLLGATAAREAGLGEAIAANAGGMITAEAHQALERALAIEPAHPKAQYLIATGLAQEGKTEAAARALREMEAQLPDESPWRQVVSRALADIEGQTDLPQQAADDQARMIEEMVAGLDTRLRSDPDDHEGWQRLIQSYVVLGRHDDARDALSRGLQALGPGSVAGEELALFAQERGVRPAQQDDMRP